MRIVAWAFIVLTVLAGVAAFLPALELQTRSGSVGGSASVSLYEAATNRDYATRFIAAYHASGAKHIGPAVVTAMTPRVGGRLGAVLGDAGDAMRRLDTVSAADADTLGTVLAATVYTFFALHLLTLALVFGDVLEGVVRRRRWIAALAVTSLTAAIAVAVHIVESRVVAEANDEIGRAVLGLGAGAWVIPIAAIAAFAAGLAVIIVQARHQRKRPAAPMTAMSGPAAAPPTGAP